MKYLTLTVLVVLAAIVVSGQPDKRPEDNQQKTINKPAFLELATTNQEHGNPAQAHQGAADADAPHWYTPLKRPEWWLAILGLPTLVFVIWQTIATSHTAKAALLSVQAFINAERPWVTVLAAQDSRGCSFWASNQGRTPAEIIAFSVECRALENVKELPLEPVYTSERVPLVSLLVPVSSDPDIPSDLELLSYEEVVDFVSGESPKAFVFYFRIRYKNVLSSAPAYETRKCYCYLPHAAGSLRVCGSEKYHCHT